MLASSLWGLRYGSQCCWAHNSPLFLNQLKQLQRMNKIQRLRIAKLSTSRNNTSDLDEHGFVKPEKSIRHRRSDTENEIKNNHSDFGKPRQSPPEGYTIDNRLDGPLDDVKDTADRWPTEAGPTDTGPSNTGPTDSRPKNWFVDMGPMHKTGEVRKITIPVSQTQYEGYKRGKNFSPRRGDNQSWEWNSSGRNANTEHYDRLPGLGKREKGFKKVLPHKKRMSDLPNVKGEMLFGLHPVLMALQAERRELHSLYVKEGFLQEPPRGDKSSLEADRGGKSAEQTFKGDNKNLLQEILSSARIKKVSIVPVKRDTLDWMSGNRPHQGVCLDVSGLRSSLYQLQEMDTCNTDSETTSPIPLWLLLYQVQDPMNFGAILRSAYLFGVNRIFKMADNSCLLSPVVSKASSGAMEIMDVYDVEEDLIQFVKSHAETGWSIVGTASLSSLPRLDESDDSQQTENSSSSKLIPVQDYHISKPTILLMGNEGSGLPDDVMKACETLIYAELSPYNTCHSQAIGSLNVSVATGIILHSMMLKRRR